MPIFEYHCAKCDKDFEVLVLGNQKVTCPRCHSKKVEKLLSAFSYKSEGEYSSSKGAAAACASCSATSCKTCGH